jgi:hypothetical protein
VSLNQGPHKIPKPGLSSWYSESSPGLAYETFLFDIGRPLGKVSMEFTKNILDPISYQEKQVTLKSRFCLTTMNPQSELGRYQVGGLVC